MDFENKEMSLKVTAKNELEMDFGWNDAQSVEDVVLLKREVDLHSSPTMSVQSSTESHDAEALMICPGCGASAQLTPNIVRSAVPTLSSD